MTNTTSAAQTAQVTPTTPTPTTVTNKAEAAKAAIEAAKNKVAIATPAVALVAPATATTATTSADGTTEKKLSPKHKSSRGVDPNLVTTWVPLDQTPEHNKVLQNAAKFRDVNVGNMLAELLKVTLTEKWAAYEADAAQYEPKVKGVSLDEKLSKMDETELDAFVRKQEGAVAALKAKIAARTAIK